MATVYDLKQALVRAEKAGDTEAAGVFANHIKQAQSKGLSDTDQILTAPIKPEKTLTQKAKGVGEAAVGTVLGGTAGAIGQLVGTAKGLAKNVTEGTYGTQKGAEQLRQSAEQTAQQFAAPFMPSSETGQEYMGNVAEAVAPLQAFPMMSEWDQIATLAKASKPILATKAAQTTKAVSEAMPQAPKITPTIAPQTAEAAQAAKNLGIDVMTSDIAKPQTFVGKSLQVTGERVPLVGTGGMRETQQAQRVQAIKDVAQDFKADTPLADMEQSVMSDLAKTRGDEVMKYAKMKKDVFSKVSDMPLDVTKTTATINSEIDKLKGLNYEGVQPVINSLEDFKGSIQGQGINNIEELRKVLGDKFKSPDLVSVKGIGDKAVNNIYGSLREDIGSHIKQFGDKNDFTKWQVANKRLSIMNGELENNALKYTLKKGNVTPEVVSKMLYSKNPSDLNLLYKNLSPDGQANARSAIIGKIYQNSLNPEGDISTAKFLSGLEKMDDNTKVFFRGEDRAKLDGLKKALALTKRAEEAKVMTNTGQQLSIPAMYGVAGAVGGWGGLFGLGTIGAIARAYESAPVRNALLKMSKAKTVVEKNTAFENLSTAIQANQAKNQGKF